MELTFSLSWNEEVVEVCDYLSCVQVGLLKNRPGRDDRLLGNGCILYISMFLSKQVGLLKNRPGRGEKL